VDLSGWGAWANDPDNKITNYSGQGSNMSPPSVSTFQNAGFETNGICYWSVYKNSDSLSAGAKNNGVGQTGTWYGCIDSLQKGDARIFEGLYLTARNYTFTAKVQSSGATVRMFARDDNDNMIKCKEFSNTSWSTESMPFTVSTTGNTRLGIERGNATAGWARIDDASLSIGGTGGTGCSSATASVPNATHGSLHEFSAGQIATVIYDLRGREVGASGPEQRRENRTIVPAGGCFFVRSIGGTSPIARGNYILRLKAGNRIMVLAR
jgi:hypothetical protein